MGDKKNEKQKSNAKKYENSNVSNTNDGSDGSNGAFKNDAKTGSKPKTPPRGKAKIVCGCFGTKYKALTNCLYCGRIICEREGYGFCPFCGYLVEKVKESDRNKSEAWRHKERLLRYDKENTKRTIVVDDQSDYFTQQGTIWMSEQERNDAEARDDEMRRKIRERPKQQLNLAL